MLSLLQVGLFIVAIAGRFITQVRNQKIFQFIQQRQLVLVLAVLFGVPILKNLLEASGAFEVYLRGDLIFSKLLTGRMPELQ